jgi:hypothetical protein
VRSTEQRREKNADLKLVCDAHVLLEVSVSPDFYENFQIRCHNFFQDYFLLLEFKIPLDCTALINSATDQKP